MGKIEGLLSKIANHVEGLAWWYSRDVKNRNRPTEYPRIFERDPIEGFAEADIKPFSEYLNGCRVEDLHHDKDKKMWWLDFYPPDSDERRAGATAWVMGEFKSDRKTIIFHHSHGMYDPETLANLLIKKGDQHEYNIIVMRAPYHTDPKRLNENGFDTLEHMEGVIAGSVLLMNNIIRDLRTRTNEKIGVVGVSMGGIVASWQGISANKEEQADFYIPIVATPNAGEIFSGSGFRNLTDKQNERASMRVYQETFVPPDIPSDVLEKFAPVVALNDPIVGGQSEYWTNQLPDNKHMLNVPFGHLAPLFAVRQIRKHIQNIFASGGDV